MPDLSVADNISITAPPRRFGLIDKRAQRRRAEELLARVGCEDVDPRERVGDLPLSRRQMVEIAKALGRNPKLLILDEAPPRSTAADVDRVYADPASPARRRPGAALHLAPHARDRGARRHLLGVPQRPAHTTPSRPARCTDDEVVQMMIGREISNVYPPKPSARRRRGQRSRSTNLGWDGSPQRISFSVGAGEIVGLGGLDGQGQRELLLALFGVLRGVERRSGDRRQGRAASQPRAPATRASRIASR